MVSFPKPERISRVKKKADRAKRLSRAQCRAIVIAREHSKCQRCGRKVTDDCPPYAPERAHVNEPEGRFKDKTAAYRPEACELLCQSCHMPGGQHAPTAARLAQIRARQK
jgi:hypothetical protein